MRRGSPERRWADPRWTGWSNDARRQENPDDPRVRRSRRVVPDRGFGSCRPGHVRRERFRVGREGRRAHAPVRGHAGVRRAREGGRISGADDQRQLPRLSPDRRAAAGWRGACTRVPGPHRVRGDVRRGRQRQGGLARDRRARPGRIPGGRRRRGQVLEGHRYAASRPGVPVLGHQGEPRNAWLPLDEMTIRGDRVYFAEHPQYHMAGRDEWPSYEEQIAARDRMLSKHPRLTYVGVHLASLEWDVDRIARFLRRYPNASVDLAARLSHLQLQSSRDRDKVRAFFIEFQDRILYGSDFARGDDQSDASFAEDTHAGWLADWRFLAGDGELRSGEFDAPFRGLALPREVIDKVYHGNARRILAGAWKVGGEGRT